MQWIANTYTLALASLTLVGGALGDRLGRRRMLIAGLALFTRRDARRRSGRHERRADRGPRPAGHGRGAGRAQQPGACSSAAFPRAERGRALGIWAAASALTGGAAPMLGGWLVDCVSWRAVFLLGVPPTLAALAVVIARVPESRAPGGGAPLDFAGAALAALAFATMTAGLIAAAGARRRRGRGPAARGRRAAARVPVGRDPQRGADDAAGALPLARVQRREPRHAVRVLRDRPPPSSCCPSRSCRATAIRRR